MLPCGEGGPPLGQAVNGVEQGTLLLLSRSNLHHKYRYVNGTPFFTRGIVHGSKFMKNVAIIGGGYTGLVAAYTLAKEGHTVTVFERSPNFGGLAGGFEIEGTHLEKAYHHLFRHDTHIIELAEELGIGDKLEWHDSSVGMFRDNKLWPFRGPLDLLRFKPLSFVNRIRAGVVVLYLQKQKKWDQFTNVTALAWMRRYAGKQVTEVIWEPLLRGKFGDYYDKVSMSWLWARIHVRANSQEKGKGGEKLGYFNGGFDVFTKALIKRLTELGVTLESEAVVENVQETANGVELTCNGKQYTFDALIATVPSHVFPRLLAPSELQKSGMEEYLKELVSIPYLGAALYIFTSSQDITPYYWNNINDVSKPFLVLINHTRLIDKKHYGGMHVYYIGAYLAHEHNLMRCSEEELLETWHRALKEVTPMFDPSLVKEKFVFRFANAQHVVQPGYVPPAYKTSLKNIYLSNFSQIFPEDRGTNHAVSEGHKIARLVMDAN